MSCPQRASAIESLAFFASQHALLWYGATLLMLTSTFSRFFLDHTYDHPTQHITGKVGHLGQSPIDHVARRAPALDTATNFVCFAKSRHDEITDNPGTINFNYSSGVAFGHLDNVGGHIVATPVGAPHFDRQCLDEFGRRGRLRPFAARAQTYVVP